MKRKILVSIDDGHPLDTTMAGLLLKHRIPAVFYIAPEWSDLGKRQILKISGLGGCDFCKRVKGLFEIGAHTMTHPHDMKKLSDEEAMNEIAGSKKALEKMMGFKKKVTKFCYPKGKFNERTKELVKKAGFKEARTVRALNIEFPDDPYETDPTIHIHPDKREYKDGKTWVHYGYSLFDQVVKEGGRFELWGHSEEVERYNMWEFLDDFLGYMDKEMKKINYPRKI